MAPSNEKPSRHRTGMPDLSSVVSENIFIPTRRSMASTAASASEAREYRLLRTTEMDPYDTPLHPEELATLGEERFTEVGDNFRGQARKAAKLSIADAVVEAFEDIKDLIETLAAEHTMTSHHPPITNDPTSGRVEEENRNVRVRGFLYAASRENDNDFHLIVGRDPNLDPLFMTMEISGLPPQDSQSFSKLKAARDEYKNFFRDNLPGPTYQFSHPPIPVEVEGSLFFDMTHSSSPPNERPGPKKLKPHMPTIWEVHPITNIVFEP